jgi:hypothetical protein
MIKETDTPRAIEFADDFGVGADYSGSCTLTFNRNGTAVYGQIEKYAEGGTYHSFAVSFDQYGDRQIEIVTSRRALGDAIREVNDFVSDRLGVEREPIATKGKFIFYTNGLNESFLYHWREANNGFVQVDRSIPDEKSAKLLLGLADQCLTKLDNIQG